MPNEPIAPDGRIDDTQQPDPAPNLAAPTDSNSGADKVIVAPPDKEPHDTDTKEEGEEDTTNINDFLTAKQEENVPEPVVTKKEEEVVKPTDAPTAPSSKKKDVRDVSDLDEEYQSMFKQNMSNEAYNKLKPIVKEHKSLKEQLAAKDTEIEKFKKNALPDSYYDNPKSVVLTPEYEKLTNLVDEAQSVSDHWKSQLIAVRKGDNKYKHLSKDKDGNYVLQEVAVTDDTETNLQEVLNFATNQTSKFAGKLENLIENHKTKTSESVSAAKELAKTTFPIFDHPEKGKELRLVLDDTIKKFPAFFRSNPMAEVLARSVVTNYKLTEMIKLLQSQGKTTVTSKTTVKEDRKRSGPTAGEATGGSAASTNGEEVTIDDFEKVKNG